MSELSKQALKVDNNQSFPNNNNGAITPSILRAFNVNMIDSNVNQTDFDTFSSSVESQFANLTSSVDPSITGSSLITASISGQTMTFTKGDGTTFGLLIPDVSGSTINTGSFATTGSNTFTGNQTINAELSISQSKYLRIGDAQSIGTPFGNSLVIESQGGNLIRNLAGGGDITLQNTQGNVNISGSATNIQDVNFITFSQSVDARILAATGSGGGNISVQDEGSILGNATSFNFNGAGVTATLSAGTASITIPGGGGSIDTGSFATTGSNTFRGDQTISTTGNSNLIISSSSGGQSNVLLQSRVGSNLTAYGQLNIGNNGASGGSGSIKVVTSNNVLNLAADSGVAIGPTNGLGNDIAQGGIRLLAQSGSLILSNNAYSNSTSSLSHLSASDNTLLANFIFKANVFAGPTIISGSGNIFTNPQLPTTGRINYVGGATNLFLNGQAQQLPQITGSAASVSGNRPTMNSNIIAGPAQWTINQAVNPGTHAYSNNILAGGAGWNFNMLGNTGPVTISQNIAIGGAMTINSPSRSIAEINLGASGSNSLQITNNSIQGTLLYNGPVSSSNHFMTQNIIAGGLTFNIQSGSRAYSVQSNNINGAVTINDAIVNAPTQGGNNGITNNSIAGNITVTNRASSSMNISTNVMGGFTITNDYDSMTNGTVARNFVVNANLMQGFIGNNIYFSGSANGTGTANDRGRGLYGNFLGGSRISASVIGDGNKNIVASAVFGQGLNIYGTSPYDVSNAALAGGANGGSAFFGRWNAEDGNRANSSETVFAIGTGVSGSAGVVRKTGFLIDSGSNTFVEGTFNVSGSTRLSGSLYIQSASAFPTQIGTSLVTWDATTGQVGQATTATLISSSFSAGEFYSMTTLSGSAGVSASIDLTNTAISNGVSIQNNSQIVVQNTGVYNIQFSAQCDAFANADTIWIWFKKNGTNISDSASKLIMQNNTAAIMTVNIFDNAVPNDYYEVVWQNNAGHGKLTSDAATGNIPGIPSVIVTVNQVK